MTAVAAPVKRVHDVRSGWEDFHLKVRKVSGTQYSGLPNDPNLHALVFIGPRGGEYFDGKGHGNGLVVNREGRMAMIDLLVETLDRDDKVTLVKSIIDTL